MITGYFEDLVEGKVLESRGRTVTQADVVGFAGLSGDFHPLHLDVEHAKKARFGEPIAHGMLTLAIASGLIELSPEAVQAFGGMDKVRFLQPVFFGDTIHVRSEVASLEQMDDSCGKAVLAITVLNQRDEPVVVFKMRLVVGTRPRTA
ncbi:MaoC/PaaZ C-terminal domain-containing protein [Amycolatopsis jejuensis]|uniref:MaoC/PaaZ C-terminal domain-containing protein n=1 Tax=Amycolatopsis jejuensis TaxID=330084 RepID=UPI0005263074|nr:MaoC/PaaZ C-terminal domain-containing protein [Amycolatopsis jejuensis]